MTQDCGIMMAVSIDEKGESHMSVGGGGRKDQLDVNAVPRFAPPIISLAEAVTPVIITLGC